MNYLYYSMKQWYGWYDILLTNSLWFDKKTMKFWKKHFIDVAHWYMIEPHKDLSRLSRNLSHSWRCVFCNAITTAHTRQFGRATPWRRELICLMVCLGLHRIRCVNNTITFCYCSQPSRVSFVISIAESCDVFLA